MNTDEKIFKALEALQTDVKDVKQGQTQTNERLSKLEDGQAHLKTAAEALKAGQDDLRERLETKADKADIQDLKAEAVKKIKNYGGRIEDLEQEAGLPHPHKH
jgi:predicted nuclease with TOPRIM domain